MIYFITRRTQQESKLDIIMETHLFLNTIYVSVSGRNSTWWFRNNISKCVSIFDSNRSQIQKTNKFEKSCI